MKVCIVASPRDAASPGAPSWGVIEKRSGSFREEPDTGNSNRVLGLFTDLPKGVK
jgi:hypothetical protein